MKRELSLYTRSIQNEQNFFFLNQVHYVAHKSDENLKKKKKIVGTRIVFIFIFY